MNLYFADSFKRDYRRLSHAVQKSNGDVIIRRAGTHDILKNP